MAVCHIVLKQVDGWRNFSYYFNRFAECIRSYTLTGNQQLQPQAPVVHFSHRTAYSVMFFSFVELFEKKRVADRTSATLFFYWLI